MRCVSIYFVFALFLPLLLGANTLQSTDYKEYLRFYHKPADSTIIENLITKTEPALNRINLFFNHTPSTPIHIFIVRSQSAFIAATENKLPEWSQAVAFLKRKTIVIRMANADELSRLPQIYLHELVHIYLAENKTGRSLPVWLHEGLAQYLSYEELSIDDQLRIANALYAKEFYDLSDLETLFKYDAQKAQLLYALAHSAVDYFALQYGEEALANLIQNLRTNSNINKVFIEHTGKDFISFHTAWLAYVDEQYAWLILLNIPDFVWLGMLILLILAFVVIKRRNRKKMQNWEDEETMFEADLPQD